MSSAIRAGGAFVELVIRDEQVQQALERTKTKLKAWGAAVDQSGKQAFQSVNQSAQSMVPQTVATVGVLGASMAAVKAASIAAGVAGKTAFGLMTTSVIRATVVMGALAAVSAKFLSGTRLSGWLDSVFSNSALAEKAGRWTRFIGALSGSSLLKDLGNRLERFGLGTAIVQGFRTGGFRGGVVSSLGAAIRSAKSIMTTTIGGLFASALSAPFRLMGSMFGRGSQGASGVSGGAGGLSSAASGAQAVATAFDRATASTARFVGVSAALKSIGNGITSMGLKVGGLAAVISGPALVAANSLVKNAEDMGKKGLIPPSWVKEAKDVADAMQKAKDAVAVAWANVGVLAIPILKSMAETTSKVADTLGAFIQNNKQLAQQIILTAAKVAAVAAGFVTFGKALSLVAPFLPLIVSPLGLMIAGLTAIVLIFPQIRSQAMQAFGYLQSQFATLGPIVSQMIQSIGNAISGGSIQAASRVLWAGTHLVWLEGIDGIRGVYQSLITSIAQQNLILFSSMRAGFSSIMRHMEDAVDVSVQHMLKSMLKVNEILAAPIAAMTWMMGGPYQETLDELTGAKDIKDLLGTDEEMFKRIAKRELEWKISDDQRKKDLLDSLNNNNDIDREKHRKAADDLAKARKDFDDARAAADEFETVRKKYPTESTDKLGSSQLGTFSTAALGRQQYGDSAIVVLRSIDNGIKNLTTVVSKQGVGMSFKLSYR